MVPILHENKHIDFFLKLGYTVLILFILVITARYGLSWGWPFLLAMLFSALIRRPVEYIVKKTRLPRGPITAMFTVAILCLGALCLYLLSSFVFYRLKDLMDALPRISEMLLADLTVMETQLDAWLHELPFLKDVPFISLRSLLPSSLPKIDAMGVVSTLSSAVGSIPSILFTVVFIFMGTFFFTVQHDEIKDFLSRNISPTVYKAAKDLRSFLFSSVFKWVRAQITLICITFCELLAAFLLMGQPNAVILSAAVAVIDALPILGVGTVLIPWALFSFVTGGFKKALWLILTYFIILCVRNSIEPRIVGKKIGLNPMITLLSMFIGFRLGGFFGLVFIPIAVLSILQLQELGYIKLWN